jgi:hypothetical protein
VRAEWGALSEVCGLDRVGGMVQSLKGVGIGRGSDAVGSLRVKGAYANHKKVSAVLTRLNVWTVLDGFSHLCRNQKI